MSDVDNTVAYLYAKFQDIQGLLGNLLAIFKFKFDRK